MGAKEQAVVISFVSVTTLVIGEPAAVTRVQHLAPTLWQTYCRVSSAYYVPWYTRYTILVPAARYVPGM